MLWSSLPFTFAILVIRQAENSNALPPKNLPVLSSPSTMDLFRRNSKSRTPDQWASWAKSHRNGLAAKYGIATRKEKRSSGFNLLINQGYDSSFYGTIAIGTPATSYNVILDTGSADLWVADSKCATNCDGISTFNPSSSSTYVNKNTSFSITYGSGSASGALGQDVVQMAGFSVPNQIFATCDTVSDGMLNAPVSGLLGLAFGSISAAGATPFWETLVASGAWDSPLMAFHLTRFTEDDDAESLEPGGTFTVGAVNNTLFTGDIEYIDIPSGMETYWVQRLSAINVQGNAVSIGTEDLSTLAAIDTGTTLIGGPPNGIAAIYAQIPGSSPASGSFDGYYSYPCDTEVIVTLSFGGKTWPIDPADFRLARLSATECLGAFFELETGDSAPAWIIGDTFLKNVYSVYRYNPPAVGFAQLSDHALSLNGLNAPVPSATIGSVAAVVSATGTNVLKSATNSGVRLGGDHCFLAVLVVGMILHVLKI